jgi:16S rRNA (cytidine1402-2'-O)-methyltransferase
MSGKLLLLPNLLDESLSVEPFLPTSVAFAVRSIQGLIAESEKMARRYLRKFVSHEEMAKCPLRLLNEHSKDIEELLAPMQKGEIWGLISDAGLACIADPGAELVWLAHQKGVPIETFVGPSSIVMALQLSGFSGQQFCFHGYLPRETPELEQKVRQLEQMKGTHIFIEAPYRSAKMLELLRRILSAKTRLCVAVNLTTPHQRVLSQEVVKWKNLSFPLEKEPAVFLIQS